MRMKRIILTIDYELFLGENSGTVKQCMIQPTEKLASILDKNNSKMTVFWDVLHYYRLLQLENSYPELKEDKILVENQILNLAAKGHDIQLHIHPHWLDAKYDKNKWVFEYQHFKIHNLNNEKNENDVNTIDGCIKISKELNEKLIRKNIPTYEVTTFRAGGYLIEPFNEIKDAFYRNGIKYDSSVSPGLFYHNGNLTYTFKNYPRKIIYNFETTPGIIDEKGRFTEIPIATTKIPLIRSIYLKILRNIKYNSLENERNGKSVRDTKRKKRRFQKLLLLFFKKEYGKLTTDSIFMEKFNYLYENTPNYSTMILHPKLLNEHTFNLLEYYYSTDKIHSISIKDFVSQLDNSNSIL